MNRRTWWGMGPTIATAVALLVALLAVVIVTAAANSPDTADRAPEPTSTPSSPESSPSLPAQPDDPPTDPPTDPPAAPIAEQDAPDSSGARVLPQRCVEGDDSLPSKPGACTVVSYGADRPTVVVWGDSHAWQQVPALRAQAERTRTNLVAFIMGACPPMDLRGLGFRGLCVQQTEQALAFVRAKLDRAAPVKVVLGGFWELYRDYYDLSQTGWDPQDPHDRFLVTRAELFDEGGDRLFDTLRRWKVSTAAIAQAPWISDSAPGCDAGQKPYACTLSRADAIPAEAQTRRWLQGELTKIRGSEYFDISRFLCSSSVCRPLLRGEPVFLDELHLDPAITAAFAPEYRDLFA